MASKTALPVRVFKFFASLHLAITLISVLAVVFGIGTFIESYHGTSAAQIAVYRTPWFSFLLLFLALNLLASAMNRLPWRKKHIGFVTTHLGIILILVGSVISKALAVEGQIAIEEGKTESRMTLLDAPIIFALSGETNKRWIFPLKAKAFPWSGRQKIEADAKSAFQIHVLEDYPKAKVSQAVVSSDGGLPALHVTLTGSRADVDLWLFLDDPERDQASLGPARVSFFREALETPEERDQNDWGALVFHFQDRHVVRIALDSKSAGKTFPVKGTPYSVEVNRILQTARVMDNDLVNQSPKWSNPAVQLSLQGNNILEAHTVFSKFPDFPTIHGLGQSATGVQIHYDAPGGSAGMSDNELRFIFRENSLPKYQVKKGDEIKKGTVEIGKAVETGWMDFKFVVDEYFDHAQSKSSVEALPSASTSVEAVAAVQIEFQKKSEREVIWLPQGEIVDISVAGSPYTLMYGLKTRPLGYQIMLRDFLMDKNPGTDQAASFKSEVTLKDVSRGINRDVLIQMNEPLIHRGWKVFQSAYQLTPGQPDISIFQVARDPGNWMKYLGTIVTVSGIIMLFYVRPLSTLKGTDPKLRTIK